MQFMDGKEQLDIIIQRTDGRKRKNWYVCALLHSHCSLTWEKRYYQLHFTDEETEFVVTELVMAGLGLTVLLLPQLPCVLQPPFPRAATL